jgi:hypothetical protein
MSGGGIVKIGASRASITTRFIVKESTSESLTIVRLRLMANSYADWAVDGEYNYCEASGENTFEFGGDVLVWDRWRQRWGVSMVVRLCD